jgi:hypothetical protein
LIRIRRGLGSWRLCMRSRCTSNSATTISQMGRNRAESDSSQGDKTGRRTHFHLPGFPPLSSPAYIVMQFSAGGELSARTNAKPEKGTGPNISRASESCEGGGPHWAQCRCSSWCRRRSEPCHPRRRWLKQSSTSTQRTKKAKSDRSVVISPACCAFAHIQKLKLSSGPFFQRLWNSKDTTVRRSAKARPP